LKKNGVVPLEGRSPIRDYIKKLKMDETAEIKKCKEWVKKIKSTGNR
jgi:hypothetical protein